MEDISRRELSRERPYWLMALASPLIWSLHFLISYLLIEADCKARFLSASILGVSTLAAVVTILTLIAIGAVIYVFFASRRAWLRVRQERWDDERGSPGIRAHAFADTSQEFLAFSGVLLSPLFLAMILITLVPALTLQPCAW